MKTIKTRTTKKALGAKEMELLKVKRHYQITIPQSLRDKLALAVGDYVQADLEDGKIIIRPVEVIPPGQKGQGITEDRKKAYAALDEIWKKMRDEDPGEVEDLVDEAVRAVRKYISQGILGIDTMALSARHKQ